MPTVTTMSTDSTIVTDITTVSPSSNCPLNWFSYETFGCLNIPKNVGAKDWFSANEYCLLHGGHLLEIETPAQQDQVALLALTMGIQAFWLGLSDLGREGDWTWSYSGMPLVQGWWSPGRPNNSSSNHDDCVLFERENRQLLWFDTDCLSEQFNNNIISQVCQCLPGECINNDSTSTSQPSTTPSSSSIASSSIVSSSTVSSTISSTTETMTTAATGDSTVTTPVTTMTPYQCPDTGELYENYCYVLVEERASWYDAETLCQAGGGHLASIHSTTENSFVGSSVVRWDNVWVGGAGGGDEWDWSDGSEWDYTKWASGHPGSGDLCSYYSYNRNTWYSYKCDYRLYYICKHRM